MTNTLKPCPFCGSEAHIYRHPTTGNYAPVCNNDRCEVYWQREYGTEEQAIEAWNTRAERTCHKVIPDEMEGYVFCSECGAEIGEYSYPNYCHICGCKVVVDE